MIERARVIYTLKKSPTLYWKKKKNRQSLSKSVIIEIMSSPSRLIKGTSYSIL